MKNVSDKTVDPTLTQSDINTMATELENLATSGGQALDGTGANQQQCAQAVAAYAASGQYFEDTSASAGTFTLSSAPNFSGAGTTRQTPQFYSDGMVVRFQAANASTAAVGSINVVGLGSTNLTLPGGGALTAATILAGDWVTAIYNDVSTRFEVLEVNGTRLESPVLNGSISGNAFLDEDNMASDSATKVASQQSIKAFVEQTGRVLQAVTVTSATTGSTASNIPFDNTKPRWDEGATEASLDLTITKIKAASKLLVVGTFFVGGSATGGAVVSIFRDKTTATDEADATASATISSAGALDTIPLTHIYTGVAAGATTIRMRYGVNTGTAYLNSYSGGNLFGGAVFSSIVCYEIA